MKPFRLSKSVATVVFLFTLITCCQTFPMSAWAQVQQVIILPFTINAEKDLTYVQEGISHMLSSRIAKKEKTIILPGKTVLEKIHNTGTLSHDALVKAVAENASVDYIITGSMTEFAGSFSLDTKVYSSKASYPLHTFFSQANSLDDIITSMNRIANEINVQVFHRETPGLVNTAGTEKNATKKDLTRANPETLIPQIPINVEAEKKPFWMFWEKEPPPSYPDQVIYQTDGPILSISTSEMDKEEENPDENANPSFWKFWKKSKHRSEDKDEEMDLEIPENLYEMDSDDVEKDDRPF